MSVVSRIRCHQTTSLRTSQIASTGQIMLQVAQEPQTSWFTTLTVPFSHLQERLLIHLVEVACSQVGIEERIYRTGDDTVSAAQTRIFVRFET